MVESLPMALVMGTLLGFLAGLGVGGGSLLVLWLTLALDTEPWIARGINLLFFIPAALIACLSRYRQGTLTLRPLVPGILAGCAAAALCSWLSTVLHTELLKKLFGIVLLAAGTREVLYKERDL